MIKHALFVCFMLPFLAFGQVKITGRVISQADTRPVAGASVFLSNATIGGITAADGSYVLQNVKPGSYELVVSFIGFERYTQKIKVEGANIDLQTLTIFPKSVELNSVTIKASRIDPDWQRNYEWFKEVFLGNTELAKECQILNPELLDFVYDGKKAELTASSADFLVIENRALGYRLKYLLNNFTLNNYDERGKSFSYAGSVLFEQLLGSSREKEQWKLRRQEVYEGSQMHFLRSVLTNRVAQEGFRILRVAATINPSRPADSVINKKIALFTQLKKQNNNGYKDSLAWWVKKSKLPVLLNSKLLATPLERTDFVVHTKQPGLFAFMAGGHDAFFINYDKYQHFSTGAISHLYDAKNTSSTLVGFEEPAAWFDYNGAVINPLSLSYEGVWSRNRVATLLPVDYEPQQTDMIYVDSAVVKKISVKLNSYSANHMAEKVYLHFDKPYYTAGDTMYFKAYVTTGEAHKPSNLSGLLYVDLINGQDKVSSSIRLMLTNGISWGDFALPRSLLKGNYRVRAYTQWMRNEGEETFFDKGIEIGSVAEQAALKIPESGVSIPKSPTTKADIKFMAEGGVLIAGVSSKVAFKAVDGNGLGIEVKGVVVDDGNKEVAAFASSHLGMGSFAITPSEGRTYTAKVIYANGKEDIITLPKTSPDAINFSFADLDKFYKVRISSSKQWYKENKNRDYTLAIYSGGAIESYTVKMENPETDFEVVKNALHTGIATATLFTASGEPLCERLLFVQNNDALNLAVGSDKNSYAARTKTGITLNVTTKNGEPAPGNFSVAVIDESKVKVDENVEPTIMNNLLLTSGLKGYIEQPNYYFTNISSKTIANLDLVMLTHGYRGFSWKKIPGDNNSSVMYTAEKGLSISGQVKFNGNPLENGKVKLFTNGKGAIMLDTLSGTNGRFVFDNLSFSDTTKFVLQARTAKGQKDVEVKPDTIVSRPEVSPAHEPRPGVDSALATYEQQNKRFLSEQDKYGINKHTTMLKEVVVKDKKVNLFQHSANLNGPGNADQVLTADYLDNAPYPRLGDAVRAKANSIIFTPDHKLLSNRTNPKIDNSPPDYMIIIVDGTPMFNMEASNLINHGILDDYSTSDIESVEILLGVHSSAIYGSIASGGAVIVTTKRSRKINNYYKEAPGVITFRANGFYKAREFYAPKYEHPETDNRQDLRSTIYWNPNIITDKDGKASFEYFNADGKGTYRVVVEGIDADGNLGRQVFRYKVE